MLLLKKKRGNKVGRSAPRSPSTIIQGNRRLLGATHVETHRFYSWWLKPFHETRVLRNSSDVSFKTCGSSKENHIKWKSNRERERSWSPLNHNVDNLPKSFISCRCATEKGDCLVCCDASRQPGPLHTFTASESAQLQGMPSKVNEC